MREGRPYAHPVEERVWARGSRAQFRELEEREPAVCIQEKILHMGLGPETPAAGGRLSFRIQEKKLHMVAFKRKFCIWRPGAGFRSPATGHIIAQSAGFVKR